MGWPRSFIDQVRRTADPVRVVGEVVALKKRGSRWVGLCPFHQEKTPSFTVSDEGLWYCFGCGEGGDILKFVMQHEGLGFNDAVRSVAERAGIPVPEPEGGRRPSDAEERGAAPRERIMAALAAAQQHYRGNFASGRGSRARAYLQERGFDEAVVERFGVGYALDAWDALSGALGRQGFGVAELEAAGLTKRRGDGSGVYDLLRDRIVFPIRDGRGRPLAFGGRVLGQGEPKYLNSPETNVFHKGRILYGIGEAREAMREAGFVMLVEGYLDLIACHQHGMANVVAPLGTAFSAEHARLLSHHVNKAVIAFDGDAAGQAAAERTVGAFLTAGFQVAVLPLPVGQDPDSFLRQEGAEGLRRALRRGVPALSFLVSRVSERADVRTPQGKAQALASLLGFVVDIEDRVERSEWIGRIAGALEIQEHLVERTFEELKRRGRPGRGDAGLDEPAAIRATARLDAIPLAERDLLRTLLRCPRWLPKLREIYGEGSLRDARVAGLVAAIERWLQEEGGGAGPIDPPSLLALCDVPGADRLLSRLAVEQEQEGEPDWEYVRGCALGIRRDALRRQLAQVQREIEETLRSGGTVDELQRRKVEIGRRIREGRG